MLVARDDVGLDSRVHEAHGSHPVLPFGRVDPDAKAVRSPQLPVTLLPMAGRDAAVEANGRRLARW